MKCYSCGNEIREGARFCHHCGADQSKAPAPVVSEPEPVVAPVAPVYEAPVQPEPVYEAPVQQEPVYEAPVQPEPVYEAPVQPEPNPVQAAVETPYTPPVYTAPQQPVYTAPQPAYTAPQPVYYAQPASNRPIYQLPDHRGLGKMFWLGLLTFGIYPMVVYSRMVEELNMVASAHDGERTMQYQFVSILSALNLGIYSFVWIHNMCNRMGRELQRRGINYKFKASTFWLWNILGSLIVVGPFIFVHKMMKAMNKINADYNING